MPSGVRAGLAALLFVALSPFPAAGQDAAVTVDPTARAKAVERELSQLVEQFEEGSVEQARVVAEYRVSQREKATLDAEVGRLDHALATNEAALTVATQASAAAERAAQAATLQLQAGQRRVGDAKDDVRKVALLAYTGQGELDLAASVLEDADTATDLGIGLTYSRIVGDVQQATVDRLRRDEAALQRLDAAAAEAKRTAAAKQADLRSQQAKLRSDRTARAVAMEKVSAELVLQRRLVQQVESDQGHIHDRIASLQAESASIAALLRSQAQPAVTQAAGPATAAAPTTAKPAPTTAKAAAAPRAPATPAPRAPATTAPRAPATTARAAPKPAPPTTARPVATTARPGATTTQPKASATPTAPVGATPPVKMSLSFPLPGWPIVSGFGMRIQPILGIRRLHEGIDIWAPAGTPIQAAGPGTVIWVGPRGGYGNAVIIDHGSGLGTVYAHQSATAASVGQRVVAGTVIGYVGQTGLAAGPHLHFEVRINGTPYDPLNFVRPR